MNKPRVYADFHNLDDCNRLRLNCVGTLDDLARQGIELKEGLALMFYTDDADDQGQKDELETEGVVHFDTHEQCWLATVDWSCLHHASELIGHNTPGIEDLGPFAGEIPSSAPGSDKPAGAGS
jgi:hypothetical protein